MAGLVRTLADPRTGLGTPNLIPLHCCSPNMDMFPRLLHVNGLSFLAVISNQSIAIYSSTDGTTAHPSEAASAHFPRQSLRRIAHEDRTYP